MRSVTLLVCILLAGCTPSTGFDSKRWKEADLGTRERVKMIPSLQAQHHLNGMHRADVIRLLGEPTSTDKWDGWDMIYVLGPTEYMPIDNEWLLIKLDEGDRVSDYRVRPD